MNPQTFQTLALSWITAITAVIIALVPAAIRIYSIFRQELDKAHAKADTAKTWASENYGALQNLDKRVDAQSANIRAANDRLFAVAANAPASTTPGTVLETNSGAVNAAPNLPAPTFPANVVPPETPVPGPGSSSTEEPFEEHASEGPEGTVG